MTAPDVLRIMVTTGIIQLLCDVGSYYLVYNKPSYKDAVERAERSKTAVTFWKNKSSQQKSKARIERAEEDAAERMAYTARYHVWPQLWLAAAFLCLTRILGSEMGKQVTGLLPFTPPSILQRWLTARGLEWTGEFTPTGPLVTGVGQACSWTLIYVLSGISIKFYVTKIFGVKSPAGGNFLMTMAETKQGKKMLKNAGIDPNDLKIE